MTGYTVFCGRLNTYNVYLNEHRSTSMNKYEILKRVYGYDTFNDGQEKVIDAIMSGRDVICVMPTGAGKSICYQIPALMNNGVTIVVSPLISLMKDQVQTLRQMGVSAAYLNSALSEEYYRKALNNTREGKYKIVYVAPERLNTREFWEISQTLNISLIAVDEAHCISQWGQDFRPSYLEIVKFIRSLPVRPIIGAFTATATKEVKADIISNLNLNNPFSITTGFDRPNLSFSVFSPRNKDAFLLKTLRKYDDDYGIIYCATRKTVERLCEDLDENGYSVTRYHAGLPTEERRNNQEAFINGDKRIVVATNAFGMGIDKSDVAFVIHYNMPKSIENYYQEAGRAGRDGSRADCILLYEPKDVVTNQYLIRISEGNPNLSIEEQEEVKQQDFERLKKMTFYATTNDCLRAYILKYFGEHPKPRCGNCSNCLKQYKLVDITEDAKMILVCIGDTDQRYGITMISEILKGSETERIKKLGLFNYYSYGKLRHKTLKRIREEINTLIAEDYLQIIGEEYPVLKVNIKKSLPVLDNEKRVYMKQYDESVEKTAKKNLKSRGESKYSSNINLNLVDKLKEYRSKQAQRKSVPAYVIFTDKTIEDLCKQLPRTRTELLEVSGIADKKAEAYGDDLLSIIGMFTDNSSVEEHSVDENEETDNKKNSYRDKVISMGKASAYASWTQAEDEQLKNEYESGLGIKELSDIHKRTTGAIRARIKKLGL